MGLYRHPGTPAEHLPGLLADGVGTGHRDHSHGDGRGGEASLLEVFSRPRTDSGGNAAGLTLEKGAGARVRSPDGSPGGAPAAGQGCIAEAPPREGTRF